MTKDQLFAWGATYSFPRMVLTLQPMTCLLAGRTSWYSFLCTASELQLLNLEKRIAYWNSTYGVFGALADEYPDCTVQKKGR